MSKPKPTISGPISAIGHSYVRVATLIAGVDGDGRAEEEIRASHAVPIQGVNIRPVMDQIVSRVGCVSYDPSTRVTTVKPGSVPRLEDLVDTIEQRHAQDLEADGFIIEPGEITVVGEVPEPGSADQWFSLTIVEKLRKAKRMLGEMSEAQRQGLGLLFEAAALHGRYEVLDHEERLRRSIENGGRAGEVGKTNARLSAAAAQARYDAAVAEACRLWAEGSRLSHVRMADKLIAGAFAGLWDTRLKALLKPLAPQK